MAKKAAVGIELSIPEIQTGQFKIVIIGKTPLIMNRFSDRIVSSIEEKQSGAAKVKKGAREPELEFLSACHRIGDEPKDGVPDTRPYGFPAGGLKKAMVTAGSRLAGEIGTRLYGVFNIVPDNEQNLLVIESDEEPTMRKDRVILSGISHVADIRYRPQFYPWRAIVPIEYSKGFISPDQIVNLLRLAGFSVGLGEWRVDKKGTFGQFTVGPVLPW